MAERTFSPIAANTEISLEVGLLAALNAETWAEAQIAGLSAEMFADKECQALFRDMAAAATERRPFPQVEGDPVEDVGEAARQVVELYQRRFVTVAMDHLKDGLAGKRDIKDVISRAEAALAAARLAAGDRVGEARSFMDLWPDVMANVQDIAEARAEGRPLGLQTGIPKLDALTGGLQTGLHVLAAEPGAGKTTLCLQWAREAAARGIPALFLTFDETPERLALKTLCAAAELEQKDFAEGRGDLAALEQARRDLAAREGSGADAAALEEARLALGEAEDRASQPAYAPPLMDVWFADADNGIAVGAYGSYLRTSDGGRCWIHDAARIDNPDELHYYAIASGGAGRLLIVGESGAMFRSRDGGASWEALSHAYEGTLFGALAFTPGDAVCAFGLQGTVLVSPDFGDTWQRLDSPTESVLAGGTIARGGEALIVGNVGTMLAARLATGELEDRSRVALRDNLAGVIEAPDGSLVVIGQGGAVRVPAAKAGDSAVVAGEAGAAPAGGG